MRNKSAYSTLALLVAAMSVAGNDAARAVELLTNGNLETSVSPPGFTLIQTISEIPASTVSASEQISFANNPIPAPAGDLGLFIKPASGDQGAYAGQNQKIDITLTQTVAAVAGRTYNFKADAQLADGYAGSVEFLDSLSPSDPGGTGTVPSPTETFLELAFLNASNVVLGSPTVVDLRTGLTVNVYQTITAPPVVAPVGTTKARVSALVIDAVANVGFQDVYFDNFTLRDTAFPASERLTNGNLNAVGPPNGYDILEDPPTTDTLAFIDFANNTPGGQQGMWLRAFSGTGAIPTDGILSQTVPGVPLGEYTFSASSFWEPNYSGDSQTFSGTVTDTLMKIEFLDGGGLPIAGSTQTLDLDLGPDGIADPDAVTGDGQRNDSTWRQFSVDGTAPAGTVSVRVSASGIDMYNTGTSPMSAFFDDFSLDGPAVADVDLDNDGDVDGNDLLLIQRGLGTTTTAADFTAWQAAFGTGGATVAAGAVPEPATAVGAAMFALFAVAAGRRRRA